MNFFRYRNARQNRPKIVDPSADDFKNMQKDVRDGLLRCEPGKEYEALRQILKPHHQGQQVKNDILKALQAYYPRTFDEDQLHVFGSSVTGIAFKGITIGRKFHRMWF